MVSPEALSWQLTKTGVILEGPAVRVEAQTPGPVLAGAAGPEARTDWTSQGMHPFCLGGQSGAVRAQAARQGVLQLTRELFASEDGRLVALRMGVRNESSAAVRLQRISLLRATGSASVRVGRGDMRDWRVLRMARQKNDVPGCFRPSVADEDLEDAVFQSAELAAGLGVSYDNIGDLANLPCEVESDPCICIFDTASGRSAALLVGMLGQTRHLNRVVLATTPDRTRLDRLEVLCEFDGAEVAPGQSKETHWLLLSEGARPWQLMSAFYRWLAQEMNVSERGPAPSIFCTWYFYGTDFGRDDLEENLQLLERERIPFDVFLLDNGWMEDFGTWEANDRFPLGMAEAADRIRRAGYEPGIWTCPFVVMKRSPVLRRYPDLVLRKADGEPCPFGYRVEETCVVDPTSPDAPAYFNEMFAKLRAWGYRYHKFDFLRAVIIHEDVRFHDRSANRAEAYRRGLELIRRAAGPDAYILACGGLFEGSAGTVDGMRVGSDVSARWKSSNRILGHPTKIKQNVFRSVTGILWHTDPDALQLRRRTTPFRGNQRFAHLSVGEFTDSEAFTSVVNHYVGGGIVSLCERIAELPQDRRALYRHVLPPVTPAAEPLDLESPGCPSLLLTRIRSPFPSVPDWMTLAVINWKDEPATIRVALPPMPDAGARVAVFNFNSQRFLGLFQHDGSVPVELPPHGSCILRLAPWDGVSAVLLGTDMHLSGGAAEFDELSVGIDEVKGIVHRRWPCELRVTAGFPRDGALVAVSEVIPPDRAAFSIGLRAGRGERRGTGTGALDWGPGGSAAKR